MDTSRFWNKMFDLLEKEFEFSPENAGPLPGDKSQEIKFVLEQFLLSLRDKSLDASTHQRTLHSYATHPTLGTLVKFLREGLGRIHSELQHQYFSNPTFKKTMDQFLESTHSHSDMLIELREIFFPEGTIDSEESIKKIREKRTVFIHTLNSEPIHNPASEILFTANALITTPNSFHNLDNTFPEDLAIPLRNLRGEAQKYFYDHPIPADSPPEANEVIYGLKGLNDMMAFEKKRGNAPKNKKLDVVLSVSTTHAGLQPVVNHLLKFQLSGEPKFTHLNVYAFTETDCREMVDQVFLPAAEHFLKLSPQHLDLSIFGVDGAYGRHYSFLKAIAPLWQLTMNPAVKGTFKIDLDQVFPQEQLVAETGHSAFEHFMTPMWGAEGIDQDGFPVELGMIAGALVNKDDAVHGLFTPDVNFPGAPRHPAEFIFQSQYPQAISTRAEMMARYEDPEYADGRMALHRIHVTGGTTGILISTLKKYQPFAPSFFGRAEDQSYIMSTFNFWPRRLAYVHQPGLIMRHDKHAFAQDAIQAAATSKMTGDFIRILYFSAYAHTFPSPAYRVKEYMEPFTGAFISTIPVTLVYLRYVFTGLQLLAHGNPVDMDEFFINAPQRLEDAIQFSTGMHNNQFYQKIMSEKNSWSLYYMILDILEKENKNESAFAEKLIRKARKIIKNTKIM